MIRTSLIEALDFLRSHPLREILNRIGRREVPWLVQFSVYAACGVVSALLFVTQVVLLSRWFLPAFEGMEVDGQAITQELRARNLFLNNSIAFVSTNLFTYFVNVRLVFKQGRHGVLTEFLFFTAVNLASFLLSQVAGPLLVREWNLPTSVAIATNAVAALLINFASRKFLIFQR